MLIVKLASDCKGETRMSLQGTNDCVLRAEATVEDIRCVLSIRPWIRPARVADVRCVKVMRLRSDHVLCRLLSVTEGSCVRVTYCAI
jgi:hypothetical protein